MAKKNECALPSLPFYSHYGGEMGKRRRRKDNYPRRCMHASTAGTNREEGEKNRRAGRAFSFFLPFSRCSRLARALPIPTVVNRNGRRIRIHSSSSKERKTLPTSMSPACSADLIEKLIVETRPQRASRISFICINTINAD